MFIIDSTFAYLESYVLCSTKTIYLVRHLFGDAAKLFQVALNHVLRFDGFVDSSDHCGMILRMIKLSDNDTKLIVLGFAR